MKTVAVHVPSNPDDHKTTLYAMAAGIEAYGDRVKVLGIRDRPDMAVSAAVIFGLGKATISASWPRGYLYECYRAMEIPVMILEQGMMKRGQYWHCGWNGINGSATFRDQPNESGETEARWRTFMDGITVPESYPNKPDDAPVILCGQIPWDATVQHSNHLLWVRAMLDMLPELTDRPVLFRPHPKMSGSYELPVGTPLSKHETIEEAAAEAWAVVTYNSTASAMAILEGTPTYYCHGSSILHPLPGARFTRLNFSLHRSPDKELIMDWLRAMSWKQFTLEEMKSGLAWEHNRVMAI